MSNAARKARKRAGEPFVKTPKKPTVRYAPNGTRVTGVPSSLTLEQWSAIMGGAQKMRAKMDAEIRAHQFPNN